MKRSFCLSIVVLCCLTVLVGRASAQQSTTAMARPAEQTVAQIVARIGKAAGVRIVADSTVAQMNAVAPTMEINGDNFEQALAALAKQVRGTTWAKLYLPDGTYKADDIADFARAQAKLFGTIGGALPNGGIEVLGKRIAADKAEPFVTQLTLKPVYLLTNPNARLAANEWAAMTAEQQKAYAQKKAADLANADDATRQQWLNEHMSVFMQLMRTLTPDQRSSMMGGIGAVMSHTENGETFKIGTGDLPQE